VCVCACVARSTFDFDATFSSVKEPPQFPVDWVPIPSYLFELEPLDLIEKVSQ
jgi:hypothetical protein